MNRLHHTRKQQFQRPTLHSSNLCGNGAKPVRNLPKTNHAETAMAQPSPANSTFGASDVTSRMTTPKTFATTKSPNKEIWKCKT